MGSNDNEQDAANNDAARSKILSAEVFDSEDVPSPDNFIQNKTLHSKRSKHMPVCVYVCIDADTSDFSPRISSSRQTRHAMGSDDNEQDAANSDAARSKILSAEVFN